MKVLVTGAKGQLGTDVVKELKRRGNVVCAVGSKELDIRDEFLVMETMKREKPAAVIHCAAWTDVDLAEEFREKAYEVNVLGTANIAKACKNIDAKMLYVSSEYVFSGTGEKPWQTEDVCEPVNVYGQTKYEGELEVERMLGRYFIVRTSWVFGNQGDNFIRRVLDKAEKYKKITVVDDQIGNPTYTRDLAVLLSHMIETDKYGYYHATNEESCSRFELAHEVLKVAAAEGYKGCEEGPIEVLPCKTSDYVSKAERSLNSRLDTGRLKEQGFSQLPFWKDAVKQYLEEIMDREE